MNATGFILSGTLLAALPATAQSVLEGMNATLVQDLLIAGFRPELSQAIADCTTKNLTEAEALAILNAESGEAQRIATQSAANFDAIEACAFMAGFEEAERQ